MDSELPDPVAQEDIQRVLDGFYWPPHLESNHMYRTTHDDNDGDQLNGILKVTIDPQGDVWMHTEGNSLRFRTGGGGGKFHRIRNALLILAEAIRQEGEWT